MQDRRSDVGQTTVLHRCRVVVGDVDKRHRVQRVGGVGCTVIVDGVVGITVVGNDDGLIVIGLGSLDDVVHAGVYGDNSLSDGVVHTRMAHHIAVGEVDHDEVVLLGVDGTDELVLHLIGAHLGLQVVGGHLRRVHENTVLTGERLLTAAVEEERHMGVFLSLGGMQLALAVP